MMGKTVGMGTISCSNGDKVTTLMSVKGIVLRNSVAIWDVQISLWVVSFVHPDEASISSK
jgi:hypothetical protein